MSGWSMTSDEVVHLPAGYLYLTRGDYRINPEHPPLAKMIAALPLLFLDVRAAPLPEYRSEGYWRYGYRFSFKWNDPERILFWARLMVVAMGTLLGYLVWRWAAEEFGGPAGLVALFLYAFSPTLLAHSGLVTTDVPLALFFFLTLYLFRRLLRHPDLTTLVLAGIAFGCALATKFSAPILVPVLVLVAAGVGAWPTGPLEVRLRAAGAPLLVARTRGARLLVLGAALLGVFLIGYGVVWGVYRFRFEASRHADPGFDAAWRGLVAQYRLGRDEVREGPFLLRFEDPGGTAGAIPYVVVDPEVVGIPELRPAEAASADRVLVGGRDFEVRAGKIYIWTAGAVPGTWVAPQVIVHRSPLFAALHGGRWLPQAYLLGLLEVWAHSKRGHPAYLFGQNAERVPPTDPRYEEGVVYRGWWYYFLATFALKSTVPTILLSLAWLAASPFLRGAAPGAMLCLGLPLTFYWMATLTSNLNIGHRHLAPIYPFLFVGAAWLASRVPRLRSAPAVVLGVLLFWHAASSLSVHPHYIAYFHELIGGPTEGYRYLSDSNLDWGQDLYRLRDELRARGIRKVKLAYFGPATPDEDAGFREAGIEVEYLVPPHHTPGKSIVGFSPGDTLAVSAMYRAGVLLRDPRAFEVLDRYRPIARAGYSIFVYRLTDEYRIR